MAYAVSSEKMETENVSANGSALLVVDKLSESFQQEPFDNHFQRYTLTYLSGLNCSLLSAQAF